jgi:hypothetical protein
VAQTRQQQHGLKPTPPALSRTTRVNGGSIR